MVYRPSRFIFMHLNYLGVKNTTLALGNIGTIFVKIIRNFISTMCAISPDNYCFIHIHSPIIIQTVLPSVRLQKGDHFFKFAWIDHVYYSPSPGSLPDRLRNCLVNLPSLLAHSPHLSSTFSNSPSTYLLVIRFGWFSKHGLGIPFLRAISAASKKRFFIMSSMVVIPLTSNFEK